MALSYEVVRLEVRWTMSDRSTRFMAPLVAVALLAAGWIGWAVFGPKDQAAQEQPAATQQAP